MSAPPGQAELMSVDLSNFGIERLTFNQRTQGPSLTDDGLYYIDDSYTSTAAGRKLRHPQLHVSEFLQFVMAGQSLSVGVHPCRSTQRSAMYSNSWRPYC